MVCKRPLQTEQKPLSPSAYVEHAASMARLLEGRALLEVLERDILDKSPREEARELVERRFGIPASLLRSLRYRPPKIVAADAFAKLLAAIELQAAAQIRTLEHEILAARARRWRADDSAIREAETALRAARALLVTRLVNRDE